MIRRKTLLIWLLAVSVLLVGCEVPAPGTPLPTVTALPTATPLSSVTPTFGASPTLMVAAASPTALPVTATPLPTQAPATSTATPLPPTATPLPTITPTPTPVVLIQEWPAAPEDFAAYPKAIITYLNASPANIVRLRPLLWEWGAISERLGGVQEADLDADGEAEWVIAMADPKPLQVTVPGNLLVIDRQDGAYRLLYQIPSDEVAPDMAAGNFRILATDDINADGKAELAYITSVCGAHTCYDTVHLYAWNAATGSWRSLADQPIEMAYAEVWFENRDDDAARELVLYGGMIGSIGAGPQRARTEVYDWDGARYWLAATIFDDSDFLYFRVLDAGRALRQGNYSEALALYEEAISNPDLRIWKVWVEDGERERADLRAFARFRLMVTHVLVKDETAAQAVLAELQVEQPDHIYAQAAENFWQAYSAKRDTLAACQAVTDFAYAHPEIVEPLSDFGYSNPVLTPDQVCGIGVASGTP